LLSRAWMAAPDWLFRAAGALLFALLIGLEIQEFLNLAGKSPDGYSGAFWNFWLVWKFPGRATVYLPYGRVLVLFTYLLIAISFIVRMPPIRRAAQARHIVIPLIGAFWPFLPLVVKHTWAWIDRESVQSYAAMLFDQRMPFWRFAAGSGLIILGNVLDVWGYAVLCRSLSIVAEARALKVTGPYRFVRHPVYLGQFLAQAGVWLFFAEPNVIWYCFYACFVAMQLYRSRVEDEVLEEAFGDRYRDWKRRTFWFV